ncbi:hypothetical protein PVAND_013440 [Polypedilum vanderplanki]|uniref:N-alpha-acetyltransferase 40 n=1 Tax=Polypedilum vanderplanki TaxID=319348 RepID=A0A9J6CPP9_POLVA|nr:hypothetical protein PVAND_013440 [Polypedilum vanderplanki]
MSWFTSFHFISNVILFKYLLSIKLSNTVEKMPSKVKSKAQQYKKKNLHYKKSKNQQQAQKQQHQESETESLSDKIETMSIVPERSSLFLSDVPLLLEIVKRNAIQKTELLGLIDGTHVYEVDGRKIEIIFKMKAQLPDDFLKWCFRLTESNMSELYKVSLKGWMPNMKKSSLKRTWGRYIIVKDVESKKDVAFVQFMFQVMNDRNTLRIYDLQIINELQGKGLGKILIGTLEKLCQVLNVEIILCKVLTNNHRAMAFFKKLKFERDYADDKADKYKDILSKRIFTGPPEN